MSIEHIQGPWRRRRDCYAQRHLIRIAHKPLMARRHVGDDCEDAAMEIEIGRRKKGRRAYGFDDIAIVPSRRTRAPDDIDISWKLGPYQFELPMLASAMDGVVSPESAGIIGRLGGLAVLNLEGIFTRYEDAEGQLEGSA